RCGVLVVGSETAAAWSGLSAPEADFTVFFNTQPRAVLLELGETAPVYCGQETVSVVVPVPDEYVQAMSVWLALATSLNPNANFVAAWSNVKSTRVNGGLSKFARKFPTDTRS